MTDEQFLAETKPSSLMIEVTIETARDMIPILQEQFDNLEEQIRQLEAKKIRCLTHLKQLEAALLCPALESRDPQIGKGN